LGYAYEAIGMRLTNSKISTCIIGNETGEEINRLNCHENKRQNLVSLSY